MAFRENLKSELEYQDMRVKELAAESGISRRTIDQYLSAAAKMPSAENAVRIAAVLGVTVEYLVTGTDGAPSVPARADAAQLRLFRKYHALIQSCERLTPKERAAVCLLAQTLAATP